MAEYPLPKFHFQVEWGGSKIGFTEVTGLEVTYEEIKYRAGDSTEYNVLKQPGMVTYGDVTLKRGTFKSDNEFYDWWNTVKLNTVERRDLTISLLNEEHQPVVVWKVKNGWAKKVTSTDLNSTSNEVGIETLVVAHEGLTIQND